MTRSTRLQASFIALLAAGTIAVGAHGATANAAPNNGGGTTMSASDCEELRLLSNYFSNAADQEFAKGNKANGVWNSQQADSLWAEAARGGCKWAVSRPAPSSGIGPVAGTGTISR